MIQAEDLQVVLSVVESYLVGYADNEVQWYNRGSYFKPKIYRAGTQYLDLYYFILSHCYEILSNGLDYTDFGITTEQLSFIIDKSNELIFYYGE